MNITAVQAVQEAEYRRAKTSVWWDIENCQIPKGCNADSSKTKLGYCGPLTISSYGNTNLIPNSIQQALSSTGIDLNHVPSGKKNASDKKILVDMLLWVLENPAPANIMLISGDGDFSDALYRLRMRGYNILVAHPQQASHLLVACAKKTWLWGSLFPDFDISSQQVLSKQSMGSESNTNGSRGNKIKGIYVPKASIQLMQQQTTRKELQKNCTKTGESAWFCKVCKHAAQALLKLKNLKKVFKSPGMPKSL